MNEETVSNLIIALYSVTAIVTITGSAPVLALAGSLTLLAWCKS